MEANEMRARTADEGGDALEEFKGRHDDMGDAVWSETFANNSALTAAMLDRLLH